MGTTALGLLIAFIPTIAWGINPTIVTKIGGKPIQQQIGTALGALIFTTIVFCFWFFGSNHAVYDASALGPIAVGAIVSGALWSLGQLMQYHSFALLGPTVAYPICTALLLVGNALVGVLFLGEWANPTALTLGIVALVLIVVGAIMTGYSEQKSEASNMGKGLFVLVISMIGFVAFSTVPQFAIWGINTFNPDNAAIPDGAFLALIPQSIGMVLGSLFLAIFEKGADKSTEVFGLPTFHNTLVGLIFGVASTGLMFSNTLNGVAVGFTISQMAVGVSTVLALTVLKEQKTPKEKKFIALGVIVMIVGAVFIGITKTMA